MTTNTHVENPVFIGSMERPAQKRQSNWWNAVAIVGIVAAVLAMIAQPSYPDAAASGGEDVPVLLEG